jgi:hypothetical protein
LVQSVAGKTGVVTLTKEDVGLGNVDNTSDANKPVSTATQSALDAKANASHTHDDRYYTESEVDTFLAGKQASGSYATLTDGKIPSSQLPSYVDDVLEYANLASFPVTGETGKIYITLDSNKVYRWSGSTYVEISASPGSTDSVPEGSINKYYTDARASAAAPVQSVAGKTGTVTLAKLDVGLGNVDNTSDANKPVSTATQTALDAIPSKLGSGPGSVIGGGVSNTASGIYGTVSGGVSNTASGSSTVGGGSNNTASGTYGTVGGGINNTASGVLGTVGGGQNNTASGNRSTVGGGSNNTASGKYGTVGGGTNNTVSGGYGTVSGGYNNAASVSYGTVGGGYNNAASGGYSTVSGGGNNTASGVNSTIIGGYRAVANSVGMAAYAAGRFAADGDAQRVDYILRIITIDATPTTLMLDGNASRLLIPNGKALFATITIAGIINGGSKAVHYCRKVAIKNVSNTTSLIGTVSVAGTDVENDAAYDVAITADNTNKALQINVTGKASETIRWVAHVAGVEIGHG